MPNPVIKAIKNAVIPRGSKFRRVLLGPAAGCVMKLDLRDHMKLYLGIYEIELSRYLKSLVRPGARSFDVGGQGGYDALIMAKASGGPVVSFECDPQAAEEMRETFARNPSYSIETVESFVGSVDDEHHMTLDRAAREHFTPDFVKMDIEGAEDEALRGASRLLADRKPNLIVEVHAVDKEVACLEILRSHGYDPQIVDQRKWLKDLRPLAHNRWLICRGRDR